MKVRWLFITVMMLSWQSMPPLKAQTKTSDQNAALRYWVAFAQMQDSAVSDQEAADISAILEGGPFDGTKYRDLVAKNQDALDSMVRATKLARCDWNLEYERGEDLPMEYARKGLALGRLNVLHVMHLSRAGEKDKAVEALIAGLLFSRDLTKGGSLFVTLIGKSLITAHLVAARKALLASGLRPEQRRLLLAATSGLGKDGLDWRSAAKRDLAGLTVLFRNDPSASLALSKIGAAYIKTLDTPTNLPALKQAIAAAPPALSQMVPNPDRLLVAKQELRQVLSEAQSSLK
jgi:hypothetical protein